MSSEFKKVAVLLGGTSNEREVSLKSGSAVLSALIRIGIDAKGIDPMKESLDQLKFFDVVFICLHGKDGEDGSIQEFLENMNIPYTGNGVEASKLCMDKFRSKCQWRDFNVKTPSFTIIKNIDDYEFAVQKCKLPFIIKPSNSGSSIGVAIIENKQHFIKAFNEAITIDSIVIAESYVIGREYTLPIIDNEVFPVIEIKSKNKLYDYEAKYVRNDTQFICPVDLSKDTLEKINILGMEAFKILGCNGWGRVDFMIDQESNIFFIEVNTIPGMTSHSLVPLSARQAGIEFDDLVLKMLKSAYV